MLLDKESDRLRALPATRLASKLPDNLERMLCYIIYTSGSSGRNGPQALFC